MPCQQSAAGGQQPVEDGSGCLLPADCCLLSGEFVVAAGLAGERLDLAVLRELPSLSRSAVQQLIDRGRVTVNGRPGKPGYRLRADERVSWELPPPEPSHLTPERIPLEVLFEDADLLVLNKPRGLVVHPAPGHRSGTLVNAVLAHAGEEMDQAGERERPGIVHRLDKDTSGVMVVAKSDLAYRSLQEQIRERTAERRYVALVAGSPRFERAEVDAPIGRHPTDRNRMAVIPPGSSHRHREAQTELRVVERFPGLALLEARLRTGRTHQIRVHCAYVHLPVVGDPLYGPRHLERVVRLEPAAAEAVRSLQGQALHAYLLAFTHPRSGEAVRFLAPPPDDFQNLLQALGSRWTPRSGPWEGGA